MMEMVEIPGGEMIFGDVWGGGEKDELPLRTLQMATFTLGKYAVSNQEVLKFLRETCSADQALELGFAVNDTQAPILRLGGEFVCRRGCEELPATHLSWEAAVAYCNWLSLDAGRKYRLPSEAEWQYAAMGGRRLRWSLGDEFDRSDYVCAGMRLAPVNSGRSSELGLVHLTGNVFEWCSDEYSCRLGEGQVLKNHRVIKGGAFILSDPENLRNAKRFSCRQDSTLACIGFRIAS